MKRSILTLVISFVTISIFSQNQNFLEKPYIETGATYTMEVAPDEIYLKIELTEADTKGKVSVEELERMMIAKLSGIGIDTQKQLKVLSVNSDFRKYFLRKPDILKNKSYRLKVDNAGTASNVVKALETANISNIELEKRSLSNIEELKIELKGKAVEKAKRQAQAMLEPIGQQVGKAIYVSDIEYNVARLLNSLPGSNTVYNNFDSYNQEELEINTLKVTVGVQVYFEIL